MFTGIIEALGEVVAVRDEGTNRDLFVRAAMAAELRVDQSLAHNGVCLTVVGVELPVDGSNGTYRVTAVQETLQRTNLGALKPGDVVNLERCLRVGDRLDGHMVQGHVDTVTACVRVEELAGSWTFTFRTPMPAELLVHKGSVCINGVSLTIAALNEEELSVAIIPYTYAHTTFHRLRPGDAVNIEFDVLGKYVQRMMGR
jgi:riboflavin synthase